MAATLIYSVTVLFRQQGATLQLQFKDFEHARTAYGLIAPRAEAVDNVKPLEVSDDFGTRAVIYRSDVLTHILEDTATRMTAGVAIEILKAYANHRLNTQVQTDAVLNGTLVAGAGAPPRRGQQNQ